MTWLSQIRSKLFANKLVSHINEYHLNLADIDQCITKATISREDVLSQQGYLIDHRRSAMKGEVMYRQGIMAPSTVLLILDINQNRQYSSLLGLINQIINYTIYSCDQLGVECIILYPSGNTIQEYQHQSITQTITILNGVISTHVATHTLNQLLQELYHNYHHHQSIIISDRLTYNITQDNNYIQTLLNTHQVLGYNINYTDPHIVIPPIPQGLIMVK